LAGTVCEKKQEYKIAEKIAELERDLDEMRSNQVSKISFGDILLDGSGNQGIIYIGNGIRMTVTNTGIGQIIVNDGTTDRIVIGEFP
jgi:hypothetical protein